MTISAGPADTFPGMSRQLLSATEIAERWGVSRQRVFQIRDESQGGDTPMPPGETVGEGRTAMVVWTIAEIEEYEAASGRQPIHDQSSSERPD